MNHQRCHLNYVEQPPPHPFRDLCIVRMETLLPPRLVVDAPSLPTRSRVMVVFDGGVGHLHAHPIPLDPTK